MLNRRAVWMKRLLMFLLLTEIHIVWSHEPEWQKRVSLNFQEAPVGIVLQALADEQKLNLVMGEDISGALTLKLENVPWQKALETILRLKRLTMVVDDNILLVSSLSADETLRQGQRAEETARELQVPLVSRRFPLQHAEGDELAAMIREQLSPRGSLLVDQRSQALLIRDIPAVLPALEETLQALDQPQQQVQIAAHIVTVSSESLRELGVEWGLTVADSAEHFPRIGRFNISLPVANPSVQTGFYLGRLSGRLLTLELSALEQENQLEIIASPRLLTTNRYKASIKQGSELPYEVSSGTSGATSIEFKEAVLGMEVTPTLMGDGRIELLLLISQNMPGRSIRHGESEALAIDKQEIQTRVIVADGETLALGGIFQQSRRQDRDKVPGFANIPLLGHLFQRESRQHSRRELVIFITPTRVGK